MYNRVLLKIITVPKNIKRISRTEVDMIYTKQNNRFIKIKISNSVEKRTKTFWHKSIAQNYSNAENNFCYIIKISFIVVILSLKN
jgi:hypothetical protein